MTMAAQRHVEPFWVLPTCRNVWLRTLNVKMFSPRGFKINRLTKFENQDVIYQLYHEINKNARKYLSHPLSPVVSSATGFSHLTGILAEASRIVQRSSKSEGRTARLLTVMKKANDKCPVENKTLFTTGIYTYCWNVDHRENMCSYFIWKLCLMEKVMKIKLFSKYCRFSRINHAHLEM